MAYTFTGTIIGYSGSPQTNLYYFESTGTFGSVDKVSHSTYSWGGGGGSVSPGSIAPTNNAIVVSALLTGQGTQAWSASGYTREAQDGNSGGNPGNVSWWYYPIVPGGGINPVFTGTTSAAGVALVLGVDATAYVFAQAGELGGANHASANTLTTQPLSDPTPGNGALVVLMGYGSTGFPTSATLTDSWGNTWTKLFDINDGVNAYISVWSAVVNLLPVVTTQAVTNNFSVSATANGTITSLNTAASASHRGVVYDTVSHSLPGNVAPGSSGYASSVDESGTFSTGAFTESLTGLTPNVTYFVRAYAKDTGGGYSYGAEVSFTTLRPNLGDLFHFGGGQG